MAAGLGTVAAAGGLGQGVGEAVSGIAQATGNVIASLLTPRPVRPIDLGTPSQPQTLPERRLELSDRQLILKLARMEHKTRRQQIRAAERVGMIDAITSQPVMCIGLALGVGAGVTYSLALAAQSKNDGVRSAAEETLKKIPDFGEILTFGGLTSLAGAAGGGLDLAGIGASLLRYSPPGLLLQGGEYGLNQIRAGLGFG